MTQRTPWRVVTQREPVWLKPGLYWCMRAGEDCGVDHSSRINCERHAARLNAYEAELEGRRVIGERS